MGALPGSPTRPLARMDSSGAAGSSNVLAGIAVAVILASMACGWLSRALLIRTLRTKHPGEFSGLGRPSSRELGSLLPRHGEMQIQFWRYLWSGKVFQLKDNLASALATAALVSDVALGAGVALLLWTAAR